MTTTQAPQAVSGDTLDAALRRARAGDEAGFLDLWRTLQPLLLRYLRVRAGDGYEDVAAETWLQVIRDLAGFTGDAVDFRRWLFTIGRNRAIDAGRARTARPLVLVPGETLTVLADDTVPRSSASAEDHALERMGTQAALARLSALPADQADMVALRVLGGLEVAVVAEIVGKTPGAVRVGVHRGLKALLNHVSAETEVHG